ncbi:hypothetical protein A3A79_03545 [Candidatus Gottesmanbacteria bacterium RIFCSPLOWO2_01_FULL_43_11b]|uniref:Cytidyltransferase-like domain-containing protein n=1 Tax=Candidatus Gottesmanbacteria bacterium RIFCSPLOWO2_01_FULL_43_11b TaxID=1798392 RepID=A0A1F6AHR0_9BACT|nr:MAG: hypothetical protein A3A79_03545 [Candidatus Gottesmanbacteria bacterium RIFCSPLOWO2_01_FULL_43_11b]
MKKVLVGGCFDFIHYGHIVFLREAKKLGDHLIVLLESDENVRKTKGEARPIHSQSQRKEMLESLSIINEVIALPPMHSDQEYFAVVDKIKPSIIAVTQGDPIIEKKKQQAQSIGAELITIPKVHTPSTSQLAKLLGLE